MRKYTVRMSFTVPKGTKAKWKEQAKAQGISMSELIRRALYGGNHASGEVIAQ